MNDMGEQDVFYVRDLRTKAILSLEFKTRKAAEHYAFVVCSNAGIAADVLTLRATTEHRAALRGEG